MMVWLHWLIDSSGHNKDDRLSVRSLMARLHLMKESSITPNIAYLSAEYKWQSMRTCTAVSDSLILNIWSFSLLCSVMTLIQVLSWDLVLELDFNLLTGTDEHIVWSDLLLSGKRQALSHFFNVDFFIFFFFYDRERCWTSVKFHGFSCGFLSISIHKLVCCQTSMSWYPVDPRLYIYFTVHSTNYACNFISHIGASPWTPIFVMFMLNFNINLHNTVALFVLKNILWGPLK